MGIISYAAVNLSIQSIYYTILFLQAWLAPQTVS